MACRTPELKAAKDSHAKKIAIDITCCASGAGRRRSVKTIGSQVQKFFGIWAVQASAAILPVKGPNVFALRAIP